jgi:hypothetical protein
LVGAQLDRYIQDKLYWVLHAPTTSAQAEWKWEKAGGTLDMDALLKEFQIFWRNNSELWEEKLNYTEAFPHLLLMAFLQRVANGEGRIEREYAALSR